MDFFSLLCFVELSKELNFTRAAGNLFISQQSLSQHIKRLEDHYGVTLFTRKPKVTLTYAGSLFLEPARQILKLDSQLKAQMTYVTENQCGNINIGITPARVQGFLPLIVPLFQEQYPHVTLTLVEAHTAELEERLIKGEVDVIIASRFRDPRLDNPLFNYCQLMNERLFFLVSDELLSRYYPGLSGEELSRRGAYIKELMDIPLIMSPTKSRIQASVEQLFFTEGKKPNQLIVSNRGSSMLSLCCRGYCATLLLEMILSTSAVETPYILEQLNVIPLLDPTLINTPSLIWRANETLPKYLHSFMDLAKQLFKTNFSMDRYLSSAPLSEA